MLKCNKFDLIYVTLFVIVWGDFDQPLWFDLDHVPHELFGCEHQLVVDHPLCQLLEEAGARMAVDGLRVLDRPVVSTLLQLGSVVEKAGRDCLSDVRVDVVVDLRE